MMCIFQPITHYAISLCLSIVIIPRIHIHPPTFLTQKIMIDKRFWHLNLLCKLEKKENGLCINIYFVLSAQTVDKNHDDHFETIFCSIIFAIERWNRNFVRHLNTETSGRSNIRETRTVTNIYFSFYMHSTGSTFNFV